MRVMLVSLLVLGVNLVGCTRKPPPPNSAPTARPEQWDEPQQTKRSDDEKAINQAARSSGR